MIPDDDQISDFEIEMIHASVVISSSGAWYRTLRERARLFIARDDLWLE